MLIRLLICLCSVGYALFAYIEKTNTLAQLRLSVPERQKELEHIVEKNHELEFAIEQFENPLHLMELARKPEFGHLKHPYVDEIVTYTFEDSEDTIAK